MRRVSQVPHVPRVPRVPDVLGVLVVFAAIAVVFAPLAISAAAGPHETTFVVESRAEVIARVAVQCEKCAWDVTGREAVVFRIMVDGRYHQHLPIVRSGQAVYAVMLGRLDAGSHTVRVEADAELTSRDLQGDYATIGPIAVEQTPESSPQHRALALAPIVYARPNTVGRFTDVPVLMWYETEPTSRGTRYRYSVIFTNEDGGTPTDRLMATWGRTTDIEYLYSVEVDATGAIVAEDFQGPEHEVLPFGGTREGRHPLLWVSTVNNMVLDKGTTRLRYALAPVAFPLHGLAREAVMDAHPWLYAVMAQELMREGKIVSDAAPGTDTIPDPRRFVFLEACGELGGSALALAILVDGRWIASDRGVPEYRIVRDGCFRAAIPLPPPLSARDVRAVRAMAYTRQSSGESPAKPAGPVRLTRLNKVFQLDERYRPGPSRFNWQGVLTLAPDGQPVEIPRS